MTKQLEMFRETPKRPPLDGDKAIAAKTWLRDWARRRRAIPLEDRPLPPPKIKCIDCRRTKSFRVFSRDLGTKTGYSSRCKKCKNGRERNVSPDVKAKRRGATQVWQASAASKLKILEGQFKRKYGITLADYYAMETAQRGVCVLCLLPPSNGKRLCVDHDHKNGRVRGLLCLRCNSALEREDSHPGFLERAAAYLHNPTFDQLAITHEPLSEAVN